MCGIIAIIGILSKKNHGLAKGIKTQAIMYSIMANDPHAFKLLTMTSIGCNNFHN